MIRERHDSLGQVRKQICIPTAQIPIPAEYGIQGIYYCLCHGFFNGMASGHLLTTSMYVSKNSYPPWAFDKGPTISTHTLSKGWVMISRSIMGADKGLRLVAL